MKKYVQIADTLEQSIRSGEYAVAAFPSERQLAQEAGVSHMTARRVVQELMDRRVLQRKTNGRVEVAREEAVSAKTLNAALLIPNWPMPGFVPWLSAIRAETARRGITLRNVTYEYQDAPVMYETLAEPYDLFFLNIVQLTPMLRLRLESVAPRAVSLFLDLTEFGLRVADGIDPLHIRLLVEHLASLGHRRVAFANFEPENRTTLRRKQIFLELAEEFGLETVVEHHPVEEFEDAQAAAYRWAKKAYAKPVRYTALFGMTFGNVRGLLRGMADHGVRAGEDIAVCTFGDRESCALNTPSITTIDGTDHERVFRTLLDEYRGGGEWSSAPRIYRIGKPELLVGETSNVKP